MADHTRKAVAPQLSDAVRQRKGRAIMFVEDSIVPNIPRRPLIVYRDAVHFSSKASPPRSTGVRRSMRRAPLRSGQGYRDDRIAASPWPLLGSQGAGSITRIGRVSADA